MKKWFKSLIILFFIALPSSNYGVIKTLSGISFIKNLSVFGFTKNPQKTIATFKKNPLKKKIIEQIISDQHIQKEFNSAFLHDTDLQNAVQKSCKCGSLDSFNNYFEEPEYQTKFKQLCSQQWCKKNCMPRTQTESHVITTGRALKKWNYRSKEISLFQDSTVSSEYKHKIKDSMDRVLQREKEFSEKDFTTFYHGSRLINYFNWYLITKLHELFENKPIKDFILLRDRKNHRYATEMEKRLSYLTNGTFNDMSIDQNYLLSVNPSLTSNVSAFEQRGECSLYFFLLNKSISTGALSLENIIKEYHLESYEKELYQIRESIFKAEVSGVLMQIFIHNNLVNRCVYPCIKYGKKIFIELDGNYISDAARLLEIYKNNPGSLVRAKIYANSPEDYKQITDVTPADIIDMIQFRIVLTGDLLLNPFNNRVSDGVKMFTYNTNQEVLTNFHQNMDSLFEKIKQDMKRNSTKSVE